ncbi:MAG: UDP-N-acetylmuramate--L-alanine ligase [Candidatus Omnitrophica bacterium]|nr:UDP-N-acetylmuramate--L-alanine ligase [Candidatus Omnitrophota bacterium]
MELARRYHNKNIHFIGIGGIGMSAVARILKGDGVRVSGSDVRENGLMMVMRREGITCHVGHKESNLKDADIAVFSSSISKSNVELISAQDRGLIIKHRAEMLSYTTEGKNCIAVTGAHGKTTTTAMISLIFSVAGKDPTAAVGGEVVNFGSNILFGHGEDFILEADESDGSFLRYKVNRAVLLNIDREHMDYFKDIEGAVAAYGRFLDENVANGGKVYYNSDDARLKGIANKHKGDIMSFGLCDGSDIRAVRISQSGLKMSFKVQYKGRFLEEDFAVYFPGTHNVTNSLAAIAVALDEGIDTKTIQKALASYMGTKRRFEIKKTAGDFMLVEDYAHHPSEIKAVLEASKGLCNKMIVVFQPHRYTRTRDLLDDFAKCFKMSNHVILTDIYAASEESIDGVSAERLLQKMRQEGAENVEYINKKNIPGRIRDIAKKDDLVLVLGAGDINEITSKL